MDAKCAIAVDAVQIKAFLPPSSMKVLQQFDWPILAHMSKKLSWTVIDFRNNLPSSLFSAISPRNHPQMPIKRTNRALRTKHPLPPLCLQINLLVPGAVVEQVWSKKFGRTVIYPATANKHYGKRPASSQQQAEKTIYAGGGGVKKALDSGFCSGSSGLALCSGGSGGLAGSPPGGSFMLGSF